MFYVAYRTLLVMFCVLKFYFVRQWESMYKLKDTKMRLALIFTDKNYMKLQEQLISPNLKYTWNI